MEQHLALAGAAAAEPFIGNTAATVAKDIINRAEGARYNKEACKYISTRVQESLRIIADSKCTSQGTITGSQKNYENVLNDIRLYVIEIDKPGKFTEKTKEWLMRVASANDIAEANKILLKKLEQAANDLCGGEKLGTNNKVTEVQKTEGLAAIHIMITQKGGIQDREVVKLQIDPSYFDDDVDNDCNDQGKSIRKRIYRGDKVATKRMPDPDVELKKIAEQSKIISLLGKCNQIEKFYGVYVKGRYLFVVTEWMQNGNLQDYLVNNYSISWPIKLKIAEQIARGLNFCSGVGIYHRDIRSKNVLLDRHLDAKLSNFDKSREVGAKSTEMPLDALRWTAPEKLEYPRQPYTDKCEVYSFSILLWEISTHKLPFSDIDNPIQASAKAKKGERPSFEDIPEQYGKYRKIIEQAWNHNPSKRPTIDTIRKQLRQMRNETKVTKLNRDFPEIDIAFVETTALDDSENVPLPRVLPIDQIISFHKEKRYKEAFPQFLQLAKKSDALALYYAGLYLYEGYGIEKDEIRALQLLQKSADGGEGKGQYMYAYACLKGSYYSPDEGLKYLKKAALINKNADALYMVSQLFLNGEHGYPIDNEKYKKYLTEAESKGSEKAKEELAKLKEK